MPTPFSYPYAITKDTPAVALEVQANFDALLQWIQTNYVQLDDTPGFTTNLTMPSPSAGDNDVVTKSYIDDNVVPTGTIWMWSGTAVPTAAWAFCRGQSVSTTDPDYVDLFAAIGYTFGGSGGNFNLPDLRGKTPLGVDPGTIDEGDTGGSTDVAAHNHTATFAGNALPNHKHTMPSHSHGSGSLTTANDTHSHGKGTLTTANDSHSHFANPAYDGWQMYDDAIGTGALWSGGDGSKGFATGSTMTDTDTHNHAISGSTATDTHNHAISGSTASVDPGDTNNASAGTPSGTVTVASEGTGDNRGPWQALNFIIKL